MEDYPKKIQTSKFTKKIIYDDALANENKKIKRIILFAIDGLGGYAFEKDSEIFNKIKDDSLYSYVVRNSFPTSSSVNFSTILTGSSTSQHGYTKWDSPAPEIPSVIVNEYDRYPTIFYLIKKQMVNSKMGAFYGWENFKNLLEWKMLDKLSFTENNVKDVDLEVIEDATSWFLKEKPSFMFIHQDNLDHLGHDYGHDTPEYYNGIKHIEKNFYNMVQKIKDAGLLDETLIIITADHGGLDYGHGLADIHWQRYNHFSKKCVEVPLIFYNKNLVEKGEINRQLFNWDIAPTIARIFGIKVPEVWIGKNIREVNFIE